MAKSCFQNSDAIASRYFVIPFFDKKNKKCTMQYSCKITHFELMIQIFFYLKKKKKTK